MISYLTEPLFYFIVLLLALLGVRIHILRRDSICQIHGTYFNVSEFDENLHIFEILEANGTYLPKKVDEQPLVFFKEDSCLCLVMDPVGISKVGEMACQMALETIIPIYQQQSLPPKDFLKKACYLAHRSISENNNFEHGGCSIALVYIERRKLYWASSGNIRIYLYDKELQPLNKLDLYKHQLKESVLQGKIAKEHVLNNQLKNELTAYLGHETLQKIEICEQAIPLAKTDQLLVATEEVQQTLFPLQLEEILRKRGLPHQKLNEIKEIFLKQKKKASQKKAVAVLASHFRK